MALAIPARDQPLPPPPFGTRVPIPTTLVDSWRPALSSQIPTMLLGGEHHKPNYEKEDLNLPLGTMAAPDTGRSVEPESVDAKTLGWREAKHADYRELPLPLVWQWWSKLGSSRAVIPGKE